MTYEQRLESVRKSIRRWADMSPECDDCETSSYDVLVRRGMEDGVAPHDVMPRLKKAGWQHLDGRAGAIRHCMKCALSKPYAWVSGADPERVLAWIEDQHAKQGGDWPFTIDWDDLKRSVM